MRRSAQTPNICKYSANSPYGEINTKGKLIMMLNKHITDLHTILIYLGTRNGRYSRRDRCLYSLRQIFRLRDIADLKIGDVLNELGQIADSFIADDGGEFQIPISCRVEIKQYLESEFGITSRSSGKDSRKNSYLFSTYRSPKFSLNAICQHFSAMDREIRDHFGE